MNAVIARSSAEILRKKPEGRLNNLVTDAMAAAAAANGIDFDFVHANYKGLRVPLPAGDIRTYKVYELMPFENYLVTLKLKGSEILEVFNYIAARGGDPIAKASFEIGNGKAVNIKVQGRPIDLSRSYIVLTNDYMANGGDDAVFYKKGLDRRDSRIKVRDAIISYLKGETAKGKSINPAIEGRIISDKPSSNE